MLAYGVIQHEFKNMKTCVDRTFMLLTTAHDLIAQEL